MNRLVFGVATGVVGALGTIAMADTITTNDRGWYDNFGVQSVGSAGVFGRDSYLTGRSGATVTRSFYSFTLPLAPAGMEVVSATFRAFSGTTVGSQTLTLSSFSGDQTALLNGTGGIAAFTALGNGTDFGSRSFTNADFYRAVTFTLNAAAISAINAALGSNFVFAATSSGEAGGVNTTNYAFGATSNVDDAFGVRTQLIYTYGAAPVVAVPFPPALYAGLAGMVCVVTVVRRRRALSE